MVYDAHDGYVLLFGGLASSGVLADTWKFSGGVWTQLNPSPSPSARYGQSMTYDAADGYVVLYGGTSSTALLSDTWEFSAGVWTKLTPAVSPGPHVDASMTYDTKDGYVVLFGGTTSTATAVGTTWKFKAGSWTQLTPTTHPPSRFDASMGYDATEGYVVLFGGFNATVVTLGDTWNFTAGKWHQMAPSTSPPARAGSAMAYSENDSELILFGGYTGAGYLSDTWTFVGGAWTKVSPAVHASSRSGLVMADGTTTTGVVVFGGQNAAGTVLNDTWSIHGLVWAKVIPRAPVARTRASMAYDEADGYVLLFGGLEVGLLGDTWKYANGIWTPLHPTVSPAPRASASMAYDQADGYVVLFGGLNLTGVTLDDTWTFAGGVWTGITGSRHRRPRCLSDRTVRCQHDGRRGGRLCVVVRRRERYDRRAPDQLPVGYLVVLRGGLDPGVPQVIPLGPVRLPNDLRLGGWIRPPVLRLRTRLRRLRGYLVVFGGSLDQPHFDALEQPSGSGRSYPGRRHVRRLSAPVGRVQRFHGGQLRHHMGVYWRPLDPAVSRVEPTRRNRALLHGV
jgi:hypothetical protein